MDIAEILQEYNDRCSGSKEFKVRLLPDLTIDQFIELKKLEMLTKIKDILNTRLR
jgi:hypothetical protein